MRHGWGKRWFAFVASRCGFGALWKHFRKFLFVKNELDETVYFRFYDPSVLRVFLPACESDELAQFFDKADAFITEGDAAGDVAEFRFEGGRPSALRSRLAKEPNE